MASLNRDEFERFKAQGNERFKAKDYEGAKLLYTKAVEAKGDEPVAYSNRAACYLNLKQYYNALDDCNKALKLDSESSKAYYRRATAQRELSRIKLARDGFERVLEYEPNNKPVIDEVGKLNKILEQDVRMVVKTFDKPDEFRSTKPLQKFHLNNKYSGSMNYNLKAS